MGGAGIQQDMFGRTLENERLEKIEEQLFSIRKRYEKESIVRGRNPD